MKLVVLSNEKQYHVALKNLGSFAGCAVICDNLLFHTFLEQAGVPFTPLDIFSVRPKWQEINQWGCEQASSWIRLSSEGRCFADVNLVAQMHHNVSYLLVQMRKNYWFARHLVDAYTPDAVVVFSGIPVAHFPALSSAVMLNYFLKKLCEERAIPTQELRFEDQTGQAQIRARALLGLRQRLKRALAKVLAIAMRPNRSFEILLVGSPKNLSTLVKTLKGRGVRAGCFSDKFHADLFGFALRHKMNYIFSECITGPSGFDKDAIVSRWFREIETAFELAESNDLFCFESVDFASFLRNYFLRVDCLRPYLVNLALRAAICSKLMECTRFHTLLVDEDISVERSFLASFFRAHGIQTFALSHANLIVDFCVQESERSYALSKTFVQSPFEKYGYECRGWDPKSLIVTGTPRYDHLFRMRKKSGGRRGPAAKMRIFCCGSAPFHIDPPDRVGFLGHSIACRGNVEIPSLEALFRVIQRYPIELIYKSRNVDDGPQWRQFLRRNHISRHVSIAGRKADINRLLSECDTMVLSYWSTAIQEAGLIGKPVILLDLYGIFSNFREFEKNKGFFDYGFCRYVRDETELGQAIDQLYREFRDGKQMETKIPPDVTEYYLGPFDGECTNRVVDALIQDRDRHPMGEAQRPIERSRGVTAPRNSNGL